MHLDMKLRGVAMLVNSEDYDLWVAGGRLTVRIRPLAELCRMGGAELGLTGGKRLFRGVGEDEGRVLELVLVPSYATALPDGKYHIASPQAFPILNLRDDFAHSFATSGSRFAFHLRCSRECSSAATNGPHAAMQTHQQTTSNRTPAVQAMGQMRGPSNETMKVPQFTETELDIFAAIARSKGLTVTSLADAIKAHENMQNLIKPATKVNAFPSSNIGHVATSQLQDTYQKPLSGSLLPPAMPSQSQRASEQSLRQWQPADSMYGLNQEPAISQGYNQTFRQYLHRGMPINPQSSLSNIGLHTGFEQSSSFPPVQPQVCCQLFQLRTY
jgi:hypothetical protein